jgi:hypothetical protein
MDGNYSEIMDRCNNQCDGTCSFLQKPSLIKFVDLKETCMYCGLLRNIASHFAEVHHIRFVQVNFCYGDSGPGTLMIFGDIFQIRFK